MKLQFRAFLGRGRHPPRRAEARPQHSVDGFKRMLLRRQVDRLRRALADRPSSRHAAAQARYRRVKALIGYLMSADIGAVIKAKGLERP